MSSTRRWALVSCLLALSCAAPPASAPVAPVDLPGLFAAAFRADAVGDSGDAVAAHLAVVRAATHAGANPWQAAALEAALDALATRSLPSFEDASRDAALANRTRQGTDIAGALAAAAGDAEGPFARGLIARALTSLAQQRGDGAEAERWRGAGGCVREALVTGPTAWAPVTGVDDPGPFDAADARVERAYPTGGPFGTTVAPAVVRGHGCAVDLSAARAGPGVRDVVVDVDVARAQTIGVALRAHGAAALRAGGVVVLRRPFELGDGEAARFARVTVTAGTLRVAARVGTARDDDSIEIAVWGEDGRPLAAHAPALGSAAPGRVTAVAASVTPAPGGGAEVLLAAAAALAVGDAREAEQMLWPAAVQVDAPPELALVYGRAVESARDLSAAIRAERARSACERVLEVWPASWEAAIAHAVLAGERRGRDESAIEALRDLDEVRARRPQAKSPLLDAYDALTSGRERLFDRAEGALARARPWLEGTALLADVADATSPRVGAERVAAICDATRRAGRDSFACLDALRSSGDHAGAMRELGRLRELLGAPLRFGPLEAREGYATDDDDAIAGGSEKLLPGDQTLGWLAAPTVLRASSVAPPTGAGAALLRAAPAMRDAPFALAPLLRAVGDEPTRDFDGVAERLVAEDRTSPILPSAATAVLAHVERYDVDPSGLVEWQLFDVRRVSGTTDVEENAQAVPPDVWGRSAMRALRRRIFKHDGRVLEPEHAPRASQAHADLAQLEQGDIVEAVYEGFALPGDTGDIGIDTPDLLPERTAVHEADIELRLPRALRGSLWSHPRLGKAAERQDGDIRVLSWRLRDEPARRIEDGVPKMDRSADVSFSTADWRGVGRALRETIASLSEHDPEITAWARSAAGPAGPGPTRATVDAVVTAAGRALREGDAGMLSDYGGGLAPVQTRTARTSLVSHDGSRSWLIARALGELGVPAEIVVAENEPFSADPSFPPHFGRFSHPLVVAHVEGRDVWIDADVQGSALPAGRISPELRGRLALRTDGSIAPLPAAGGDDERDEVDVRLALDAKGDARGTLSVVLRGRSAQDLSESFLRVVGAERQRALRDVVLAWLPWANVDDVQLASTDASWQVGLRAEVSVSGYAQLEAGKTWLLPGLDPLHGYAPRAHVSGLGATFASRAGRQSALAVNSAVQYHVHRRVELPKGAAVVRLPGPIDIRTTLIEASRAIAVGGAGPAARQARQAAEAREAREGKAQGGQTIEDDFTLGVATGTIPTADYDAFVAVTRSADDGFLASTRVSFP